MAPSLRVFRWLFVISCFICLGIRATDQNMLSVKDENGNTVIPKSPVEGCNINGKEYSEGAAMMIPNDWSDNVYDSKCMKCICSGGQAKDCQVHSYCETGNEGLCSRWRNATGQCCPVCDCYHDGKVMEAGSTWAVRQGSSCSECTCGDNKIAKCTIKFSCICSDGYDAIPVPGKCCPKCVPKVTTTAPTPTPEILVETTKRPPPTFPPPPDME